MSSTSAFSEEAPTSRSFNNIWKPIMYENDIFFFKIKIENCIYEHILYSPKTGLYFWEVIDQSHLAKRIMKVNNIKSVLNPNELQHILVQNQPKFTNLLKQEASRDREGPSHVLLIAEYEINERISLNFEWYLKRMTWAEENIFQSILLMMVHQVDQMICLREELNLREVQLARYKKTDAQANAKIEDNRKHKATRPFSFDSFDSFFFQRNQCASGVIYMSHYFISPEITIKNIKRNPDYTNEVPTGQPQAVMQLAMGLKILARYQRSLYRGENKMSLKPTNKYAGDIPCGIRGMRGFFDIPYDHHQYSFNLFALDCNCRCLVCPILRNGLLKDGPKFMGKDPRHACNCQCAKCIIWRKELLKKEEDGYVSEIEDYDSNLEPGSVSNLDQQDWSYELAVMYSSKNSYDLPEVTMARQRIEANKEMTMEMANNEAQIKKCNKTIKNGLPLQIDGNLRIEKYYDKLIKYLPSDDQDKSTKSDFSVLEMEKCNHVGMNRPIVSLDSLATSKSSKITKKLNILRKL